MVVDFLDALAHGVAVEHGDLHAGKEMIDVVSGCEDGDGVVADGFVDGFQLLFAGE